MNMLASLLLARRLKKCENTRVQPPVDKVQGVVGGYVKQLLVSL